MDHPCFTVTTEISASVILVDPAVLDHECNFPGVMDRDTSDFQCTLFAFTDIRLSAPFLRDRPRP